MKNKILFIFQICKLYPPFINKIANYPGLSKSNKLVGRSPSTARGHFGRGATEVNSCILALYVHLLRATTILNVMYIYRG